MEENSRMRLCLQPRRALSLILMLGIASLLVPLLDRSGASRLPRAAAAPNALAVLPVGWPDTLQLGMADSPGGAAAMKATAPFGFRYQYLTGGANTGSG